MKDNGAKKCQVGFWNKDLWMSTLYLSLKTCPVFIKWFNTFRTNFPHLQNRNNNSYLILLEIQCNNIYTWTLPGIINKKFYHLSICLSFKASLCEIINYSLQECSLVLCCLKMVKRNEIYVKSIFFSPMHPKIRLWRAAGLLNNQGSPHTSGCKLWKHTGEDLLFGPMTHSVTLILLYQGLMYSGINTRSDRFYISEFLCCSVFSLLTTYVSNIPSSSGGWYLNLFSHFSPDCWALL